MPKSKKPDIWKHTRDAAADLYSKGSERERIAYIDGADLGFECGYHCAAKALRDATLLHVECLDNDRKNKK